MNKKYILPLVILALAIAAAGYIILYPGGASHLSSVKPFAFTDSALAAKFDYLSANGNSSCSGSFQSAVQSGTTGGDRLEGSCCSPMNSERYASQVEGLKKYANIPEIPPDPYDIDAALAQKLSGYYTMQLTSDEQKAYDYAMANSMEKGPCCCKCWRWYVYGGLGKLLIQKYHFTGQQITEIWNLSDGCGGVK